MVRKRTEECASFLPGQYELDLGGRPTQADQADGKQSRLHVQRLVIRLEYAIHVPMRTQHLAEPERSEDRIFRRQRNIRGIGERSEQ